MRFLDPKLDYADDSTSNDPDVASLEHLIPESRGGSRALWNTVAACRQCNSERGDEMPDAALLERLERLNLKRGFVTSDVPGTMIPDTFGPVTPASTYLCDLINAVPGTEGRRLRATVAKRLSIYGECRSQLKSVPNRKFAHHLMLLFIRERETKFVPLGQPYDNLIHNVLTTYVRREFFPER